MQVFIIVGAVLALFVLWTVYLNVKGRKREKTLSHIRGKQTRTDFVSMFSNETEQVIAWRIYDVLQSFTFTHQFAFRKDDLLFGDPLVVHPPKLDSQGLSIC